MTFYSNGKLLLTGEYLVLDAAPAIALPTKLGQFLEVQVTEGHSSWKSYDHKEECWFSMQFDLTDILADQFDVANEQERTIASLLREMHQQNADCFSADHYQFTTKLDFDRNWGLGSSSTLVNNLAQFAQVDPYQLLAKSFGGSGYDIACAQAEQPIVYQDKSYQSIKIPNVIKNNLYFIYLNKKQNSRKAIKYYKDLSTDKSVYIEQLKRLTQQFLSATHIDEAKIWMTEHEEMISRLLQQKPVKESRFPDFKGAVKSLGAWGGDFVAAIGDENCADYFKSKGYSIIFSYKELIKD
jgi:mevalonate kinase